MNLFSTFERIINCCVLLCSGCLLHLLQNQIDSKQQTVVFTATKHHVEYLHQVSLLSSFEQIDSKAVRFLQYFLIAIIVLTLIL